MDTKELFNDLISKTVKPLLKESGFTKKALTFYKKKEDLVFLFNFQKSAGNSSFQTKFYINCGIHSAMIDRKIEKPELIEPKEYECHFRERISSITNNPEYGYIITGGIDLHELSRQVVTDLKKAIVFFDKVNTTSDLADLMAKQGLSNYEQLFEYLLLDGDDVRLKDYVVRLYQGFGQEQRWKIFENKMDGILKKRHVSKEVKDILGN